MTQAEKILKLIETVDPNDTAKLDEIDQRVFCYLKIKRDMAAIFSMHIKTPKYTRSRDTLKAIRPESWTVQSIQNKEGYWFFDICGDGGPLLDSFKLKTEELAELHAIIQAIEYERNNEKQV